MTWSSFRLFCELFGVFSESPKKTRHSGIWPFLFWFGRFWRSIWPETSPTTWQPCNYWHCYLSCYHLVCPHLYICWSFRFSFYVLALTLKVLLNSATAQSIYSRHLFVISINLRRKLELLVSRNSCTGKSTFTGDLNTYQRHHRHYPLVQVQWRSKGRSAGSVFPENKNSTTNSV